MQGREARAGHEAKAVKDAAGRLKENTRDWNALDIVMAMPSAVPAAVPILIHVFAPDHEVDAHRVLWQRPRA